MLLWGLALPLLLRLLPLPSLLRLLTPHRETPPSPGRASDGIALVSAALSRLPPLKRRPCLYRSLLLYKFLREAGYLVRIHFGIGKTGSGTLIGHSWLTLDGRPFLERADPHGHFTTVFSYPPEGGWAGR